MYRRRSIPSAWREMERMQREMSRLFNDFQPNNLSSAPSFPAMNIWANEDGQVVTAEIPGIDIKDLEISIAGEVLTISSSRADELADELADEDSRYHRQERGLGNFKRSIQLPHPVQTDKVEAGLDKGVLTITLPRAEADKPKRIHIKSVS